MNAMIFCQIKKILYAGTKVIHLSFIGQDSGKRPSDWNMETQCAS